jgi:hypothetical protein
VGTRDLEHARVEVYAYEVRKVAKPLRGDSRDNPRPTRSIQDPVTGLECHVCEHQFRQGSAKGVHRLAFIELRGIPF